MWCEIETGQGATGFYFVSLREYNQTARVNIILRERCAFRYILATHSVSTHLITSLITLAFDSFLPPPPPKPATSSLSTGHPLGTSDLELRFPGHGQCFMEPSNYMTSMIRLTRHWSPSFSATLVKTN
ncbi:hypothetical protein E2C01_060600 [Portunus trituberculatus]|uniref:Uncharacterized protein n=1 Tax=Portunus trituberculatus TaxID=210409 RepID=A0A5B7H5X7_PORTR|nr:hypothetical protein [Portunus trituberculatus]